MSTPMDPSPDEEKTSGLRLLSAAASHDIPLLKSLLKITSAKIRDDRTGYTPLHAAIASFNLSHRINNHPGTGSGTGTPSDDDKADAESIGILTAGRGKAETDVMEDMVLQTVRLLFENGAIWNDLDARDETPGCIAYRLGLERVYQAIVAAGVRAEVLLMKLGMLDGVEDDEDEDGDGDGDGDGEEGGKNGEVGGVANGTANGTVNGGEQEQGQEPPTNYIDHWNSNDAFLRSSLKYTDTTLLDSSQNAVMMDWEKQIMTRHAELLLPKPGLRSMNIGHGMGIVDQAMLDLNPGMHHIVEAHPAVLKRLRETGWYGKPNVTIHEGRWQDILPKLVSEGVELDAVYYDTFAESYQDLKDLFEEHVIALLAEGGKFGFYHGLGADRRVCYDVYTQVVELDLKEAGYTTEWEELSVPKIEWTGVRRPYWNVDVYRLPTCRFAHEG